MASIIDTLTNTVNATLKKILDIGGDEKKIASAQNKVNNMYGTKTKTNTKTKAKTAKTNTKTKAKTAASTAVSRATNKATKTGQDTRNRVNPGSRIVNSAKKYLGTPYVWGGDTLDEGGLDCSGFVYRALNDSGYKIGRTTAQGYRSQGSVVNKADMQPGDLVFFGKNGNASHIGIYLGNGQMIHSSGGSRNTASNPGKGVSITNADYRSDFIEARRY